MKVFKFGGASINSIERIKATTGLIATAPGEKILVIVSAMGKTTNALEAVVQSFWEGRQGEALELFRIIKQNHIDTLKYLTVLEWNDATTRLNDFFTEVEWLLHDKPVRNFDYYYDQVVCSGELMSSSMLASFFKEEKLNATWIDVRDVIRTDDNFREALVDWTITENNIAEKVTPLFNTYDIVVTQGFIGSTDENESTTLGREGSDYSAAIFANLLPAKDVTIWKDVDAVMSADPRLFPEAVIMPELSYLEVIEMAYYGAQVIHPNTIKPLQNKNIPLYVKSFLDPSLPGTIITDHISRGLPPVIVKKEKQVLAQFRSTDYSFVEGKTAQALQDIFREIRIKPNLSQHTAISWLCCFDDHAEKIDAMALAASAIFEVDIERGLTLLTVRHYEEEKLNELANGKTIILEQRTPSTVQQVLRG